MIFAMPPPPPTIVAAVKSVYPRSPLRIEKICRVGQLALVRARVRTRETFVAVRSVRRGWRVAWVDGKFRPGVTRADIQRLRTRCLAP